METKKLIIKVYFIMKEKVFPNNLLQEMHENLISLMLFYGEEVIEDLLKNLNPLEKEFTILSVD